MTNRARSIPELPNLATPSSDDLLIVVDDAAVTANTKKCTLHALLNNSNTSITVNDGATLSTNNFILRKKLTPTSSAVDIQRGMFFFDDNYLYIATSDDVLKRVPLESF